LKNTELDIIPYHKQVI